MKILTVAHMDKLDTLYLEEYLDTCVQDLKDIAFSNPYPPEEKDYMKFVIHVYGIAKKYGLDNEKYAFALMLAWHVRGKNFVREQRVVELFNKEMDAHTKYQYFMKIAIETMEAYENQGEKDDSKPNS